MRPEIVSLSQKPVENTADLLVAEGKISSHISHGNLVRFTVDFENLSLNADVVYKNQMDFTEGDTVYAAIRKDLIVAL